MPNFFPMDFSKQMERIGSSGSRAYQNMLNKKTAAEDRAMALEDRDLNNRYKEQQISSMEGKTNVAQQKEDRETKEHKRYMAFTALGAIDSPDDIPEAMSMVKKLVEPQTYAFIEKSKPPDDATGEERTEWIDNAISLVRAKDYKEQGKALEVMTRDKKTGEFTGKGHMTDKQRKRYESFTGGKLYDVTDIEFQEELAKSKRDSEGSWGQPKEGTINKPGDPLHGTPVTYLTNKEGEVKELKGIAPKMKKGMKFTSHADGTVTFESGGDVTQKTQADIEGKIIKGADALVRITGIIDTWDPRFQKIPDRFSAWWSDKKSRVGMEVSPEDQKFLEDFSVYRRRALDNINRYIKDITGAQMSEKEADRLRKAVPDPGEGIFDGDGPIVFASKLRDIKLLSEASLFRYRWYREKGLTPVQIKVMNKEETSVSLDDLIERKKARK